MVRLVIACLSLFFGLATLPLLAEPVPPRLILQITVDQLRGDLPERHYDQLGEGGFRYLYQRGTVFRDAHHAHANTETIVGHVTLATGAHPSAHGMIGNVWLDRDSNHLGDRDEHLPTNHGFDEFFGNLYHLNAEEEPEHPDYPSDPSFRQRFGPRGVIRSYADGRIEDTGPLTKKRMETVDEETLEAAIDFIDRQHRAGKPFFVWWNGTRMHFRTHVKEANRGISGQDEYADGMVEHDGHVGQLLDKLDELGIVDNTLVFYSTDNGPHYNTWPDAAATPFRGEKNTNWEGGWRVPAMVRWPGKIQAGSVSNEIMHHMDWLPTLIAVAGDSEIKEKLLEGHSAMGRSYNVHLDGYNFLPYLTGKADEGPRKEVFYFSDDGDLTALRYQDWKFVFMEQRVQGTLQTWSDPFIPLRVPKLFHLRRDPYERADITSNTYWDWLIDHAFAFVPAQAYVGRFLETFKSYPPRQEAASFSVDQVMDRLKEGLSK